jgi:hypothetical protein
MPENAAMSCGSARVGPQRKGGGERRGGERRCSRGPERLVGRPVRLGQVWDGGEVVEGDGTARKEGGVHDGLREVISRC